jgi:hypothetical protein
MTTVNTTDLSKLSQADLIALVSKLAANQAAPKAISYKVSGKGAISIYGLGRFPVTLYKGQFDRLDQEWDAIRAFRKANDHLLSTKPAKGE